MRIRLVLSLLVVFLFCFESLAEAQGRGGRGVSRTALAMVDAVQSELEITDEQKTELSEMRGARRGEGRRGGARGRDGEGKRGDRGEGKRERGDRGEGKKRRGGDMERGDRPERGGDRAGRRGGRSLEQVQQEIDTLSEVLLPHQMTRLNEIYVQVMGAGAIQDPKIAEELEITEDQVAEMQDVRDEMREAMRGLRDGGDREAMREKFAEINAEINEKIMAVLSDEQQEKLDKMKGEEFELPEDAMPRRGRRGRDRGPRTDF